MNTMTDEQRKGATDAALAEILTEMGNWNVGISPDGMSISDYINSCRSQSAAKDYIQIIENKISLSPEYAKVRIVDVDKANGAVTSYNPSTNTYTVSFCGTRADYGEWSDNAIGLSEGGSQAQRNAAAYFDLISTRFGSDANVVVSGHSKGGNKAAYVTMFAKNRGMINNCYALDGQQFAKNDIEIMQSQTDYDVQRGKILLIAGENDYVSQLGERIIPDEQIVYLRDLHRLAYDGFSAVENDHMAKYLFVNSNGDFTCELASETDQGAVGGFVRELYLNLSDNLSEAEFHMTCRVLMNTMEGNLNKEELLIVLGMVSPYLSDTLYHTEAGKRMLQYLPVSMLSNEDMQGPEGALKLMAFWLVSLDDRSPAVKAFKKAFKVLTGANFSTADGVLSELASVFSKAMAAYSAVKSFLYVNFRIGADGYNRKSAAVYASQSGRMKFDTDQIRKESSQLYNVADNIERIRGGFNSAFYSKYSNKNDAERLIHAIIETAAGNEQAWESGRKHLSEAAEEIRMIARVLERVGNKLDETEETAKKYGTL